jgi:hypothetical protein
MVDKSSHLTFPSRRIRCRTVLATIAVIAVGVFATVYIHERRAGRLYYTVRGYLGNIYRALEAYDHQHGHLPPMTTSSADKCAVSWRTEVAVYYDRPSAEVHAAEYHRERPWDEPPNLQLQDAGRWRFMYKPDGGQRDLPRAYGRLEPDFSYLTYFKAITGADTAFAPGVSHGLKELPNDLVLVVRVEESDVHWMAPVDLLSDDLVRAEETKHFLLGKNGYAVLFADGESWVLSSRLPYGDLCRFFTIDGAQHCDRDTLLGPYRIRPWFSALDETVHRCMDKR